MKVLVWPNVRKKTRFIFGKAIKFSIAEPLLKFFQAKSSKKQTKKFYQRAIV